MGRGVSSGGGQSSLGYLFGSDEAPKPAPEKAKAETTPSGKEPSPKPNATPQPVDVAKQIPAGIHSSTANTMSEQTDRPSTKVHSAPGGGSSLGYLFGGGSN